jgi:hypothetical protein
MTDEQTTLDGSPPPPSYDTERGTADRPTEVLALFDAPSTPKAGPDPFPGQPELSLDSEGEATL